jgi:hypothetical protein
MDQLWPDASALHDPASRSLGGARKLDVRSSPRFGHRIGTARVLFRDTACEWDLRSLRRGEQRQVRDALDRARAGYPRRMTTRVWRGWTSAENAEAYKRFLLTELFPTMGDIDGFQGAEVLTRPDGDEVEFVTLTRFDSLDAVRAFAGDHYETPVLEPRALELLARYEKRALHYASASYP